MIICVSDAFAEDYVGGAELTTQAILDGGLLPIIKVRSHELNKNIVELHSNKFWIFGNIANLSTDLLMFCAKTLNYCAVEYDYKYCKYRSPEKHVVAEGSCGCENSPRGKVVSIFFAKAKNLWFMSTGQRDRYLSKYPFLQKNGTKVLSSVFNSMTLDYIQNLDTSNKEDVWLIQDSPSWIKGTQDSIQYAKSNNLNFEVFKGLNYQEMLNKFAKSRGFIFLPRGADTCPRTAIEAKLLGCETIFNDNVQHKDEEWFNGDVKKTWNYLRSRTNEFWNETITNSHLPVPKKQQKANENTHFKVIIPVYNSEGWIAQAVESVKAQNYSNFSCFIGDDISTDGTYERCLQAISHLKNFHAVQNKEKKYALQNIYDLIVQSDPNPEDVIVVLDGDDWLSSRNVLSRLNEYYNDGCMLTYGSFVEFPRATIGAEASEYPKHVIESNSFREDTWRASHLKTYRYSLWRDVDPEDLKDDDGKFFEMTYDQAMMFPMLEMAGDKAMYVPEVTYVYNTQNPNAINKTKAQKQHDLMKKIRKKKKYARKY
jgi:hypothetical protein